MNANTAELDHRESNGIAVSLRWNRTTNDLTVLVVDGGEDEAFELRCSADEALDVFHHPYAYAATRPALYRYSLALAQS